MGSYLRPMERGIDALVRMADALEDLAGTFHRLEEHVSVSKDDDALEAK